jgi:DNA-binding beta-propeller fold protein YncE
MKHDISSILPTAALWLVALTALSGSFGCGDDDSAVEPDPDPALPSYLVPGDEVMAAIAINPATGEFFVDSATSGKIYRGVAGAESETTLELFADLTSAGISGGGHLSLSADGGRLVMLAAGGTPRLHVIDLAGKRLLRTVEISPPAGGGRLALQDVALSPDGARAYLTNSAVNAIHTVDLSTFAASSFPISSEFPFISNSNQGFINATGLTITADGRYLVVGHLVDKHVYRISLASGSLGQARRIDTGPYNVSGNGLWLGADGELIQVGGDELRVYRFALDGEATAAPFQARYQSDELEPGLTYAVAHRDRVLVLNGSGSATGGGGGGGTLPPELIAACVGKAGGDPCSATVNGAPITGTCTDFSGALVCLPAGGPAGPGGGGATPKLPIRVLQLQR